MAKSKKTGIGRFLRGIKILHEDRDIIVIDKPVGLLTMKARGTELPNAQGILTNYIRKGNPRSQKPVHIVHRLDRETSGILVFALTKQAQDALRNNWIDVEKKYLAIVHGIMKKKTGKISSYLAEDKRQFVYSTKDKAMGKLSHTQYKVLEETRQYSLLEVNLQTGRKNQIRVHMEEAGHPIVGDTKYGAGRKKFQRMALHAKSLSFFHPYTNEWVTFESKTPDIFRALMRQGKKTASSGTVQKEKNN